MTLGLPKNHVWESAGAINAQGESFLPNMPTEEVFTAPDFRRAYGYVSSTKPLSYNGNIIEGIKVTFKDGEIVDITADEFEKVRFLVCDSIGMILTEPSTCGMNFHVCAVL